ncbi:MAG TPA: ribose 5-phosphate isomerase B [Elusimicrobiota bacterium]|nr:ribose 5-phosphate isomerase B [Elusimicrobiota bacterium]
MRIAIGSDHAGYKLKTAVGKFLKDAGHRVVDFGVRSEKPADYPDYARKVALAVASGKAERGVVVCGSGVGASVAANKVPGVRAALCHDVFSARQGVEDDAVNVLCLGERVIGTGLALDIARAWMNARFSGAARHVRRLNKVTAIEKEFSRPAAKTLGR